MKQKDLKKLDTTILGVFKKHLNHFIKFKFDLSKNHNILISNDHEITSQTYFEYKKDIEDIKCINIIDDIWIYFYYYTEKHNDKYDIFLSFHLYIGEINEKSKILLFRAEWDYYSDLNNQHHHPQPHWHFINKKIEIATFDEFKIDSGVISKYKNFTNINKKHFFTYFNHLNEYRNKEFNEENIILWLDNLLTFIKQEFIEKK